MRLDAHDVADVGLEMVADDEALERGLFARRAVVAAPPPFAEVLVAIARDDRASRARARRTVPRVAAAALAIAACVAGLFSAARALSTGHERIVADRGDASAPLAASGDDEGAACILDRSLFESRDDRCVAPAAPVTPAPLASYAVLETEAACTVAGP